MKLFRIFAIAAMAMLSSVSAQAGVVLYSNMGNSGLDNTGGSAASDSSSAARQASGFKTGSVAQVLSRASLVVENLGSFTAGTRTVGVYSSVLSGPEAVEMPFNLLFTSNGVYVDGKGVYTFGFADGTILAANTTFWIVPEDGVTWFHSSDDELPSQRNSSGYTFVGTRESLNSGSNWADSGDNAFTLALAVPEPALTSFLCLGGIALIRRRRKK